MTFGLRGEVESVALAPAAEAVGAFEKFVADADAPLRGDGGDVGDLCGDGASARRRRE